MLRFPTRTIKLHFLAVLVFCFHSICFSQYRIDVWDTENGIPQNSINNLVQTADGYIWGVTFGGIFRFDGVRFKVFDHSYKVGLKENRFTTHPSNPLGAVITAF